MNRAPFPCRRFGSHIATLFFLPAAVAYSQVCTVSNQDNCQSANAGLMVAIDKSNGPSGSVADDFVALGTQISEFCWQVGFVPTSGNPPCYHAPDTAPPPPDRMAISFFENANGLPGAPLFEVDPVIVTAKEWHGKGFRSWDYTTTFDPPLSGFVPGQRYWATLSAIGDHTCAVYAVLSEDGNGFYLSENNGKSWDPSWSLEDRSGSNHDVAFCMGGDASPATDIPPPVTGACCQCNSTCNNDILWEDCLGQLCKTANCAAKCAPGDQVPPCLIEPLFDRATFFPDQDCSQITCEDHDTVGLPGDDCENPIISPSHVPGEIITIPFNTNCATTDGRVTYPNGCETGDADFENDVWIEYSTSGNKVQFDFCGLSDFDTTVAIFTNGTDVCPNVDATTGLRTACPPPLEDLVDGQCRADLCNSDFFDETFDLCAVNDQCFLIRVGGDQDAGVGAMTAQSRSANCVPTSSPTSQTITNAQGALVANVKNRVLSFAGGSPGSTEALRVTFAALPGAFSMYNGLSLWVGPPVEYDGRPSLGYSAPCDDSCQIGDASCSSCPGATFLSSELQCEPFYTDWSSLGVIHVRDPLIVPSVLSPGGGIAEPATYHIQFIHQTCELCWGEGPFSNPLVVTTAGWGDIAELFNGQYVAPDQRITIFDTLAILQAFGGIPDNGGLLSKVRTDLVGVDVGGVTAEVDGAITIGDLVQVIAAFGGGAYGFDPGPWPCP